MILKIIIGTTTLDLFQDEGISLTSSIADIEDITKNTTDYSKSFTVPATATNNILFKHYYNANIDNTFDARTTTDGRIEIDGFPFRVGKFLLQKVIVTKGVATSYMIHFWGNLVSIKDTLGKDELKDLDLTAYDHDYTSANVLTGLTSSLSSGDIIYTLLVKKQYYYTTDLDDSTMTDKLANIGFSGGAGSNGVAWNDLRPAIRMINIIEQIETDYPTLVFSRHFFGRSEFTDLFMWLNNDSDKQVGGGSLLVDFDSGSSSQINLTTNIGAFFTRNTSGSGDHRYWRIWLYVTPSAGYTTTSYTIQFYSDDDDLFAEMEFTGAGDIKSELHNEPKNVDEYTYAAYYKIVCTQEFKFTTRCRQQYRSNSGTISEDNTFSSEQTILSVFTMEDHIPKLKIIDFIKGLFKAFKLVVIPQQDGTIYVNTLREYYEEGTLHDLTAWLDSETIDVERGNILNEINYNFEEPSTILNMEFKKNNGIAYGDEEALLKDDAGDVLEGDTLNIKLPFEQIVYERLIDLDDEVQTTVMYGAVIDDKTDPVNPKAHIFYNISVLMGFKQIGFIDDDGDRIVIGGFVNTAFHSQELNTPINSFLFSEEFSEWNGEKTTNNLYTNYHQEYIDNLFNIKRRNFRIIAKKMPLKTLLKLTLNDIIQFKYNYYRIDKFTTDLVTTKTEFNLVNAFDFTLTSFSTSKSNIYLTKVAQAYYSYVTNLDNYSVNKIDNGDGTGWCTVTDDGVGNLIFTVTLNTASVRSMFITITNTDTSQTIDYYLEQEIGILAGMDFQIPGNAVMMNQILTIKL